MNIPPTVIPIEHRDRLNHRQESRNILPFVQGFLQQQGLPTFFFHSFFATGGKLELIRSLDKSPVDPA